MPDVSLVLGLPYAVSGELLSVGQLGDTLAKTLSPTRIALTLKKSAKSEQVRLQGLPEDQRITALGADADVSTAAEAPPARPGFRLPFQRR